MKYEITFLLNEEEELKNLSDLVTSLKGKIIKEEKWGKKTLAYAIKKTTSVDFYNWTIEMSQKNVGEFKRKLGFNEKLIRFLLLKLD